MAARDVAVVVDLDPTRLLVEAEQLGSSRRRWAAFSDIRRSSAARAFWAALSTSLRLVPRTGRYSSTRRLARTANAAANSAA